MSTKRLSNIFKSINNEFSLVVNEVYGTGSMSLKLVRCPANIELARAITQAEQANGILRFSKDEMLWVMEQVGFCVAKSPVKGAGMEHIYYFKPAAIDAGLQAEAVFSQDRNWVADKQREERLTNTANRFFSGS